MGFKKSAKKSSDPPIFSSEEAKHRFEELIYFRTICAERGFEYKNTASLGLPNDIAAMILGRNWQNFCAHSTDGNETLVREFYANFDDESPFSVIVRGQEVPLISEAINELFSLDDFEDAYQPFVATETPETPAQVLNVIAVEGAEWEVSPQGVMRCRRASLKPLAKVWYTFLQFSLLPSTHIQTISKDRAYLLFCILSGRSINVGEIIASEIRACASKRKGNLFFPTIITKLCLAASVPATTLAGSIAYPLPINETTIARLYYEPRQPAAPAPPSPHTPAAPSGSTAPASSSISAADIQELLANQRRILKHQQHQEEANQAVWRYMQVRDATTQAYMEKQFRKPLTGYPPFPGFVFQAWNPDSSDDDDAGGSGTAT